MFRDYIKRHRLTAIILLLLPIVVVIGILLSKTQINADSWIGYAGAVLAYYGTMCLSSAALYQAEKANTIAENANKLSEKVYLQSQRSYCANFAIDQVDRIILQDCHNDDEDIDTTNISTYGVAFCNVSSTPASCESFSLKITNYGEYPINKIIITNRYVIGRKRTEESVSKELDATIAPHKSIKLTVCDTPQLQRHVSYVYLDITCKNMFGNEMTQELKITTYEWSENINCVASIKDGLEQEC